MNSDCTCGGSHSQSNHSRVLDGDLPQPPAAPLSSPQGDEQASGGGRDATGPQNGSDGLLSEEELAGLHEHIARWHREGACHVGLARVEKMLAHIDVLTAQRDQARDIAVALEQELAGEEHVPEDLSKLSDDELHARFRHPLYEYETTTTPRKSGISIEPEGAGWEPNYIIDVGADENGNPYPRRNWERFEYHEEEHWRRRKTDPPIVVAAPAADRRLDQLLGFEVRS